MKAVVKDTRRALYCGPTAVCAVTGAKASKVLSLIEEQRGGGAFRESDGRRKGIRGMGVGEVVSVLRRMGYAARYVERPDKPTLAQWLADRKLKAPRIIHLRGHFVAVDARHFVDNHVKAPVPLGSCPRRRARVHGVIVVGDKPFGNPFASHD